MLCHPEHHTTIAVAVHAGEDVPVGTLRGVLRKAGLTPEELRELLRWVERQRPFSRSPAGKAGLVHVRG